MKTGKREHSDCPFPVTLFPGFVLYGSSPPFFPFFLAGSISRGRVTAGGGVSIFGAAASALGCGFAGTSSTFGGGGIVNCSSFGFGSAFGGAVLSTVVLGAS